MSARRRPRPVKCTAMPVIEPPKASHQAGDAKPRKITGSLAISKITATGRYEEGRNRLGEEPEGPCGNGEYDQDGGTQIRFEAEQQD